MALTGYATSIPGASLLNSTTHWAWLCSWEGNRTSPMKPLGKQAQINTHHSLFSCSLCSIQTISHINDKGIFQKHCFLPYPSLLQNQQQLHSLAWEHQFWASNPSIQGLPALSVTLTEHRLSNLGLRVSAWPVLPARIATLCALP